jgi:uncharacterized protein YeaO (DUF488 family)
MIKLKRAYEKPAKDDGERILVERLWPRGLTRLRAKIDLWLKDVAPSTELRRWFGHDPNKWDEFRRRYKKELKENNDLIKLLKRKAKAGTITLTYAARDEAQWRSGFEAVPSKRLTGRSTSMRAGGDSFALKEPLPEYEFDERVNR